MDLSALRDQLKAKGAPLVLNSGDAGFPQPLRDFLSSVPGKQVTLASGDGIDLQGSILTISGACADVWPVQGMYDVSITLSAITITINDSGASPVIDGDAIGSLPVNSSVSVTVNVTSLRQEGNPWRIKLAQDASSLTPAELLLLGKVGAPPFEIPASLDALSHAVTVNQDQFQILFYPNTEFEAIYTLGLSVPQARWPLITGLLSFEGIDLAAFQLTNSSSIILTGHLQIDAISLDVGVALNLGDNWVAFLKPAQGQAFPGIAALAGWAAGGALSDNVTGGFTDLGFDSEAFDAAINGISVGFNCRQASLDYVEIVSLLTIGALRLDVTLRLPRLEMFGTLHDNQPVKVKDLLSSFELQADGVPDNLSIIAAGFKAQLHNGYYSANLTVDGLWAAGPVNLEEVGLFVAYKRAEGFTGQFNCKLGVGQTSTIDLEADYAGAEVGWRFAGATEAGADLSIGDLVSILTEKFGVNDIPQPIRSLSLTNLSVTYETGSGKFTFTCEGDFDVANTPTRLVVAISVNPSQPGDESKAGVVQGTKGYSATFGGQVVFSGLEFDLVFNTQSAGSNLFIAAFSAAGKPDKAAHLNAHDLVAGISTELAGFIPSDLIIDLKSVKFVFLEQNGAGQFLFALDLGASLNLSNLPLVGQEFPSDQTVGVDDLQVVMASAPFSRTEVGAINDLIPGDVTRLPLQTSTSTEAAEQAVIQKGLNITAQMKFGGFTQVLGLPISGESRTAGTGQPTSNSTDAAAPDTAAVAATDNAKWFTLQKSFGPVRFERIGVQYRDAVLWFLLDGSLSFAGLTLSLDGLSAGSPLDKFEPKFDLRGIGIDYSDGPVEIAGAFLRKQVQLNGLTYDEYDGAALIRTPQFALSAIGSYADLDGHPSLFAYAVLDYPIGGPAFFFVTGLAAGFGYNRSLRAPAIDQVARFPLVAQAMSGPVAPNDLEAELRNLQQYIPPAIGEIFLAVGVKFTSFKIVDSFALLTVAFGARFEVNLLGLSTLISPPQAPANVPPLAVAQMAVKASFIPDEGFLGAQAQLTPASYIFTRDCHLTGGFAFYSWFSGPRSGEFVITLGGYHPSFKVPDYYPKVPRLGVSWQVNRNLSVKGGAYYALTSSALMAGGNLQATWHDGNLKAWFNAQADFIISWKPYHYDAYIHVNMGVSYTFTVDLWVTTARKTISVDVGADLHIWGPEFSGRAHIKLSVVSFDVTFGNAASRQPQPISWDEFRNSFLPGDAEICGVAIKSGLTQTTEARQWMVNPKDFCLVTNSVIPSKTALAGNRQLQFPEPPATDFGVAPMAVAPKDLSARHKIEISRIINNESSQPAEADFDFVPIKKKVPVGLWGKSLTPTINGQGFIEQALSGFEIRPKMRPALGVTSDIERANLRYNLTDVHNAFYWEPFKPFNASPEGDDARRERIRASLTRTETIKARNRLLQDLGISMNPTIGESTADAFSVPPQVGTFAR